MKRTPLLMLLSIVMIVSSCKKSTPELWPEEPSKQTQSYSRLSLTKNEFDNLMTLSHRLQSTAVIKNYIQNSKFKDFVSLREQATVLRENKTKLTIAKGMSDGPVMPWDPGLPPVIGGGSPILIDSLVEDQFFANLLSPNGEIAVDDAFYKVTEYGTFVSAVQDTAAVVQLLAEIQTGVKDVNQEFLQLDGDVFQNGAGIVLIDTYEKMGVIAIGGGSSGTSQNSNFNIGNTIYSNVDYYEFNDAKTWAGKFLQEIFGRDHFKNYSQTNDARLKVNFYSRNWGIFSSVGATCKIQTKGWTGLYRTMQNYDEMKLGWAGVIIKLDVPSVSNPNAPASSGDFWTSASNALQSKINFNFKANGKDYLVYSFDQIIAIGNISNDLPSDLRTKINTVINKLNNTELNLADMLESQLDKQAIDRLVTYIKGKVGGTKEVAFIKPGVSSGLNAHIYVPSGFETRTDIGAEMSHTFDFQTALIGWNSNSGVTFSAAKSLDVKAGEVVGLGKLNGQWAGISVIKRD